MAVGFELASLRTVREASTVTQERNDVTLRVTW
jgi:hypothetical protein